MFLDGLDETDKKIVELLISNARTSYSDIGQRVNLSRVAVSARVQALEQRGIIEGYTAVINPQRIGGAVSCYFEIEIKPESLGAAERILADCGSITQVYRVTGSSRLHVHAVVSNNDELQKLTEQTVDKLPGLVNCSCNMIISRIKDIKGLRL